VLLTLAACGDDGVSSGDVDTRPDTGATTSSVVDTTLVDTTVPETTVEEETTVPETTVPETTVPETTVVETTAAPTTTVAPAPCGEFDPIPGTAGVTSSVPVDWDGDTTQESVATLYDTVAGNMDYRLRVEGPDYITETAVITDGVIVATVLGAVQVDYSGGSLDPQPQELLATVGNNSSGYNVAVYFRDDQGCIDRFKGAGDSELVYPIHASIGTSSGLACEGTAGAQFIVRTTASATATPNEYDVHDIKQVRNEGQLLDEVDIPGTVTDDGSPTSPFLRYTSITNCGF